MKKVNIKGANGIYYKNMILIDNMDDLQYYHEKIYNGNVKDAAKDICNKITKKTLGHVTNTLADACNQISSATGAGSLWTLSDISSKVIVSQIKLVARGKKIVINSVGGYFDLSEKDIIEPINNTKYTTKDIKITQYTGGKHFYAKIAGIEVEDEYGDKKWNTYKYAESVAKEYINKLNKNI